MAKRRHRLTPALVKGLCERIRGGAFEHVASESLGLPFDIYQGWLARGSKPRAGKIYREFYESVRQAKAHARCLAEIKMRTEDPRAWLLHGPGKETSATPGWSSSPPASGDLTDIDALRAEVHAMIAAIYEALKPFPEARVAVVRALDSFPWESGEW
jgi:hypothetical protein